MQNGIKESVPVELAEDFEVFDLPGERLVETPEDRWRQCHAQALTAAVERENANPSPVENVLVPIPQGTKVAKYLVKLTRHNTCAIKQDLVEAASEAAALK